MPGLRSVTYLVPLGLAASLGSCALIVGDVSGHATLGLDGGALDSTRRPVDVGEPPKDAHAGGVSDARHEASRPDSGFDAGSRYAAAVLTSMPVAYWRLGEEAGAPLALDETDGGHNGQYLAGTTTGTKGLIEYDSNTAATFNGVNGSNATGVNVGSTSAFDFSGTSPFSIEAWIEPRYIADAAPDPEHYYPGIFARQAPAGSYVVRLESSPASAMICFSRSVPEPDAAPHPTLCATSPTATPNAATYLVAMYDGSMDRLYINGVPNAVQSDPVELPVLPNVLAYIGIQEGYYGFGGTIDEVAIYPRPLTSGEIAAHYAAATTR